MNKITALLSIILLSIGITMQAQDTPKQSGDTPVRVPFKQPTVFELVDEVRDSIGLDTKEFDKVYSAYDKYNKKVFGEDSPMAGIGQMPHGRRPGGRPGMGGPGGGMGMGGPGGGMGRGGMGRGGMGMPPSGMNGQGFDMSKLPKKEPIDWDKFEKTKRKEEEKLCKNIKKVFKKNPDKYVQWLAIRDQQLKRMFPQRPTTKVNE